MVRVEGKHERLGGGCACVRCGREPAEGVEERCARAVGGPGASSARDGGGGEALLEEIYKAINIDVVSFLYGPMPTQPSIALTAPVLLNRKSHSTVIATALVTDGK